MNEPNQRRIEMSSSIYEVIKMVGALDKDESTAPILKQVNELLDKYVETLAMSKQLVELNKIEHILLKAKERTPSLNYFVLERKTEWVITLNEVYTVTKQKNGDSVNLEAFVNYVTQNDDINKLPPSVDEVEQSDVVYEDPTASELDAKKKQNVEEIKKIKESQVKDLEAKNALALKDRCDDIEEYLIGVAPKVRDILDTIELVAQSTPDSTHEQKIAEIIDLTKQNDIIVKLLVQVYKINGQLKQDQAGWKSVATIPEEIITITSQRKRDLFAIAVANLDLVHAHDPIRQYSLYELIITMFDYCDKTSSLTIVDTPEAIAVLASGIYDILLNKDLNRDFVYMPDSTNPLIDNDVNWFKKSHILHSYIRHIPYTGAIEYMDEPVKKLIEILNIAGTRDLLFANQRLAPVKIKELLSLAHSVVNDSESEQQYYSFKYKKDDVIQLVVVSKLDNETIVCIVRDKDGILSYIQYEDGKSYQQQHSNDTANVVIKWLENIIPSPKH